MLAGEDLGRREQRRLRAASTAISIAISATSVLPEPTSPWSRRSIGTSCCHVAAISRSHAALRAGRRIGQLQRVAQPPVALQRHAPRLRDDLRAPASARAGWRTPRHKRAARARIGEAGRGGPCASAPPSRQPRAASRLGSIHSASSGTRSSACAASSPMRLVGEPFGQRIDRLAQPAGSRPSPGGQHMVRMDHLQLLPVAVELARRRAWLAERQLLLRPARIVEIGERQVIAGAIRRMDPERPAPAALAVVDRASARR
jgi:hypothetical protein